MSLQRRAARTDCAFHLLRHHTRQVRCVSKPAHWPPRATQKQVRQLEPTTCPTARALCTPCLASKTRTSAAESYSSMCDMETQIHGLHRGEPRYEQPNWCRCHAHPGGTQSSQQGAAKSSLAEHANAQRRMRLRTPAQGQKSANTHDTAPAVRAHQCLRRHSRFVQRRESTGFHQCRELYTG
jgi:hypothetical protein